MLLVAGLVLCCKLGAVVPVGSWTSQNSSTDYRRSLVNNVKIVVSVPLAQHGFIHSLSDLLPLLEVVLLPNSAVSSSFIVSETERVVFAAEVRVLKVH